MPDPGPDSGSDAGYDAALSALAGRVAVLTGAGMSTDKPQICQIS